MARDWSEQLIHSQWAYEGKVLFGEGFAGAADIGKPVLEPVVSTRRIWMPSV